MNDKLPHIYELFNIAEDKTWLSCDKVHCIWKNFPNKTIDKLPDPAISGVATYLGPPLMVGHVCSVQYSHTVPYNRFILLKKSTTEKKQTEN